MSESNAMSRFEEAGRFVASVQNLKVRAALEYALTTVIARRGMDSSIVASSEFDLRFFLEAIKAMFEREEIIRAIIDGKDELFRW